MREAFIYLSILIIVLAATQVSVAEPRTGLLRVSGDNTWEAYVNGEEVGRGADWQEVGLYEFELTNGSAVIAVHVHDAEPGASGSGGFLADIVLDNGAYIRTGDEGWKASQNDAYLKDKNWVKPNFDDSGWEEPQLYDQFGGSIWGFGAGVMRQFLHDPDCTAYWIWAGPNDGADEAFFRYAIGENVAVRPYEKYAVKWGQIKVAY